MEFKFNPDGSMSPEGAQAKDTTSKGASETPPDLYIEPSLAAAAPAAASAPSQSCTALGGSRAPVRRTAFDADFGENAGRGAAQAFGHRGCGLGCHGGLVWPDLWPAPHA